MTPLKYILTPSKVRSPLEKNPSWDLAFLLMKTSKLYISISNIKIAALLDSKSFCRLNKLSPYLTASLPFCNFQISSVWQIHYDLWLTLIIKFVFIFIGGSTITGNGQSIIWTGGNEKGKRGKKSKILLKLLIKFFIIFFRFFKIFSRHKVCGLPG